MKKWVSSVKYKMPNEVCNNHPCLHSSGAPLQHFLEVIILWYIAVRVLLLLLFQAKRVSGSHVQYSTVKYSRTTLHAGYLPFTANNKFSDIDRRLIAFQLFTAKKVASQNRFYHVLIVLKFVEIINEWRTLVFTMNVPDSPMLIFCDITTTDVNSTYLCTLYIL